LAVNPIPRDFLIGGFINSRIADSIAAIASSCPVSLFSIRASTSSSGAVSLALSVLSFGTELPARLRNAHAAGLHQAPQIFAGRHPAGRLVLTGVED
jgi:hypothetical protein